MYSRKIRLLSLNMILVMLLTLIPAQAREETDTGTDEGKKTEYTVTLNGNGGTLGNENEVKISYSAGDTLEMRNYPFTRDGYLLVGWSEDASGNGNGWFADRNLTIGGAGDKTFYAVWFKIPEGGNYAIFNTSGYGTIAGAVSDTNGFYCVELTDEKFVTITMTLTAPNCPAADFILEDVRMKVEDVPGVSGVEIQLTFEPEWNKDMMSEEAMLELGFL